MFGLEDEINEEAVVVVGSGFGAVAVDDVDKPLGTSLVGRRDMWLGGPRKLSLLGATRNISIIQSEAKDLQWIDNLNFIRRRLLEGI